jgi:hypothetical protein
MLGSNEEQEIDPFQNEKILPVIIEDYVKTFDMNVSAQKIIRKSKV